MAASVEVAQAQRLDVAGCDRRPRRHRHAVKPHRRTPLPPAELAAAVCTLQVELLIATVSMALMSHRQLLPATARFTTG